MSGSVPASSSTTHTATARPPRVHVRHQVHASIASPVTTRCTHSGRRCHRMGITVRDGSERADARSIPCRDVEDTATAVRDVRRTHGGFRHGHRIVATMTDYRDASPSVSPVDDWLRGLLAGTGSTTAPPLVDDDILTALIEAARANRVIGPTVWALHDADVELSEE